MTLTNTLSEFHKLHISVCCVKSDMIQNNIQPALLISPVEHKAVSDDIGILRLHPPQAGDGKIYTRSLNRDYDPDSPF